MKSARRNVKDKGQYVLFVDLLGFAELVEQDEQNHIRWAAGLSSMRSSIRTRPGRLKKLVADLTLDVDILKEVSRKNGEG